MGIRQAHLKDWPQRKVVFMHNSVKLSGNFFQPSSAILSGSKKNVNGQSEGDEELRERRENPDHHPNREAGEDAQKKWRNARSHVNHPLFMSRDCAGVRATA
jgi:hypothetical protein